LVVEAGVVPRLVQLLARFDLPKLQFEASWAITNIACSEVHHARLLIDNGRSELGLRLGLGLG
jgi:importin subunit alpha-1